MTLALMGPGGLGPSADAGGVGEGTRQPLRGLSLVNDPRVVPN